MDCTKSLHNPHMAPHKWDSFWNGLTLLVLLGIVAAVALAVVWSIRAGAPEVPPSAAPLAVLPPTSTPGNVALVAFSPSAAPSLTPPGMQIVETPTIAPTPFPDEAVDPTFDLRGAPTAMDGRVLKPEHGCAWTGIAGQAFDMQGDPIIGLSIWLGGRVDGHAVQMTGMTGTVLEYGAGGYELTLAGQPVASTQSLWVQLVDAAGVPLSEKARFDTFAGCEQNLVLINFKQIR